MKEEVSLTVSKVLSYFFCPRNIFYSEVSGIEEKGENNFKMRTGKEIHDKKLIQNKNYLRKDLKVIKKEMNVSLYSQKESINGKADEILFLEDGTIAPLDYKYSEYAGKMYDTYIYQLVMYSMMIEENFNVKSKKGYIVFTRSNNKIVEVN
ncbi:MAG: CRISPR-associated protein Cas4, partial [Pseudoleptotrichia goodfellowii]|nr:CRISPR-associated protein Cas4 [Pseudoleptotrichia goodfellowii]